jgi:hypothetical protein
MLSLKGGGPRVRIRLPPAVSLRTSGPSGGQVSFPLWHCPVGWDREFESAFLQRRVSCELDSWIMVGADGLGSKEGVRVFSLIVLAQFVWRVSSASDSARRPQVVNLRIECPDLIVLFGGAGGMCGNASRLLLGAMVYCRRNTAGARSPRSRGAFVPQKPQSRSIISRRLGLWRQKVAGSTAGSYWSTRSLWTRPS